MLKKSCILYENELSVARLIGASLCGSYGLIGGSLLALATSSYDGGGADGDGSKEIGGNGINSFFFASFI